jgi:hypothetical protein
VTKPDENNMDQIAGKLFTYLRAVYNDFTLAYDLPLAQLKGGMETGTYQFQLKGGQKELNQPLVQRLYPEYLGSDDAVWESSVQIALAYITNPTALHLRAMNMLFEGLKEKGALVIVPSSAVDSMNLGGLSGMVALSQQANQTHTVQQVSDNQQEKPEG